MICNSPSQIYHSALPFSPSSSWLCECYAKELSQEVKVVRGLLSKWGMCSRTVVLNDCPLDLVYWNNTIAVGSQSRDITILDGITGTQLAILSGHTGSVRSSAFSSDGTSLVSGSHDQTVKLWDVQTGGVIKTFYGHTDWVLSVSISADCTTIASGSDDKTIRLWDIWTRECYCIIEQQNPVACVTFSHTNPRNLTSESGGKVWQWDVNGHQISTTYNGSHIAFSSDATQFASCQGAAVMIRNSDSGAVVAELHVAKGDTHCPCFSPNGRIIAVADGSTISVWDITSSDPCIIETFAGHTSNITSLVFSSPFSLVSSSTDHSIKFWQISVSPTDPVVVDPKSTFLASAPVMSITLQAKDSIAISSDSDGVVRTWDILTGLCKASFQTPADNPHQCDARLINNKLIFVWYVDRRIHIYDVGKGELLQTVKATQDNADDIRISGDGSKVFCLYWRFIQAWSIWTGEVLGGVGHSVLYQESLIVDGSRVWVYSLLSEAQGWDFGITGSSPVQLPNMASPHPNVTKVWDTNLSRIKDAVTGRVVFQLPGRFTKPTDSQWDSHYLVAGYKSGEVLILDTSHILSQ